MRLATVFGGVFGADFVGFVQQLFGVGAVSRRSDFVRLQMN
jgi:hypothetical protein